MNVTMCQAVGGAQRGDQVVEVDEKYGEWLVTNGYAVRGDSLNDTTSPAKSDEAHSRTEGGSDQPKAQTDGVDEEPKRKRRA